MKFVLILLCLPLTLLCQNTIGLPDVINYSKLSYNAGLQNWDIKQDKNGIIYVANNEGLLTFDGRYWKVYPLPNKTNVRSVEIGPDNRVYVGGQDELGYFAPSPNGQLQYHSLTNLIPARDKSFSDVWDVAAFNKEIFFRSSSKIFKYANSAIVTFNAPQEWVFLGVCNNRLYAHDYKMGLMTFDRNIWSPVFATNGLPANDPVTAILPGGKDSAVVTTLKNGLYNLSTASLQKASLPNASLFERERIYAATAINADWIALATNNGGIYIIDKKGEIIQRFSRTEGLQNNNVLSIFLDNQSNLWLGLNNGIDFIAYNSPIKNVAPLLQDGSGYTAIVHNNHLYAGTSNGLYSVPLQPVKDLSFSKGSFSLVNNSEGQAWTLADINNQLLLGHHEGAFIIRDNNAYPVFTRSGFWNFVPLPTGSPAKQILAGNYKGLMLFNEKEQQLTPAAQIPGFDESSRFVAIDEYNHTWVSHPYHGVYRIVKNPGYSYSIFKYTEKKGLPSLLNNHVFKMNKGVLVGTEKGVFMYNAQKDAFEPSPFYRKLLGDQSIRYLKQDASGNTWFIHEKQLGVLDVSGKEPTVIYLPELNNKLLSGFEFIYSVDGSNVFLGGEKGFYHINYEKYKKMAPDLKVQVRTVRIVGNKDSLLFGGYFNGINEPQVQNNKNTPRISHNWRSIHFEFSSSLFNYQTNLEYTFRLKNFDENWSEWTKRNDKEYTNLPAGNYTFEVKVRNNLGNDSPVSSYSFTVLPPWYQTTWATLLYILLAIAAVYWLYKWQKKKFVAQHKKYEEEQSKLLYIHELERNKAESELVSLRNKALESDINFKNAELASSAMHLVKKGELLTKIKGELTQVMKRLDNETAVAELKKTIKSLSDDGKIDDEWEHFAKHFDKVHSDFLVKLKETHPTVTSNELKLSAYLRMNLSTKEIAQLMNISVRGVEISRYRLRKKLGLSSEVGLFDYLIKVE